jgi:regulator of RNase E activity RraA
MIDSSTAEALESVSTATLSAQLRRRGIENAFLEHLTPGQPGRRMVGEARTLRYTALREDVFAERGGGMNAQKRVVDTIRTGEVLVIEARGDLGAGTIGDILALRLQRRGGAGVVTDGGVRDTPTLRDLGIPFYFGASHGAVLGRRHVPMDSDLPITCGGVLVMPGDVMCGDAEGVLVIPAALAAEVARDAVAQEREERYIAEQVDKGESLDGLYPMGEAHRKRYECWSEDGQDEVS